MLPRRFGTQIAFGPYLASLLGRGQIQAPIDAPAVLTAKRKHFMQDQWFKYNKLLVIDCQLLLSLYLTGLQLTISN